MSNGKRIADVGPDTPLADAARRVLLLRLGVVRDYLPRALKEPDKDPEHVHQLRVGTRRAGAALDIFARCLPERTWRAARRQVRRIRRAAGEARDWDVFLLTLRDRLEKVTERQQPGFDFLLGYTLGHRTAAQGRLEETVDPEKPFGFEELMTATVAAVRAPGPERRERVLIDLARPQLLELFKQLEVAADRDLTDYEDLHQVRIAGKRLRYAMEVFATCFRPAFREELYPAVEEMQDILGRANDSHVAGQRLALLRDKLRLHWKGEWKRLRPGVESLLSHHRRRLPQEKRRFLKWWRQWRQTGAASVIDMLLTAAE